MPSTRRPKRKRTAKKSAMKRQVPPVGRWHIAQLLLAAPLVLAALIVSLWVTSSPLAGRYGSAAIGDPGDPGAECVDEEVMCTTAANATPGRYRVCNALGNWGVIQTCQNLALSCNPNAFTTADTICVTPAATSCSVTPTVASFTATPAQISAGGSSILFFDVQNADGTGGGGVELRDGGTVLASSAGSGSHTVSPASTTTYTLWARPNGGGCAYGKVGERTVTVAAAADPTPAITSSLAPQTAAVGQGFSYTIMASNNPTSFGATSLPPGLGVDATTGTISGIPTTAGSYSVRLTATNTSGTGAAVMLPITVNAAAPGACTGTLMGPACSTADPAVDTPWRSVGATCGTEACTYRSCAAGQTWNGTTCATTTGGGGGNPTVVSFTCNGKKFPDIITVQPGSTASCTVRTANFTASTNLRLVVEKGGEDCMLGVRLPDDADQTFSFTFDPNARYARDIGDTNAADNATCFGPWHTPHVLNARLYNAAGDVVATAADAVEILVPDANSCVSPATSTISPAASTCTAGTLGGISCQTPNQGLPDFWPAGEKGTNWYKCAESATGGACFQLTGTCNAGQYCDPTLASACRGIGYPLTRDTATTIGDATFANYTFKVNAGAFNGNPFGYTQCARLDTYKDANQTLLIRHQYQPVSGGSATFTGAIPDDATMVTFYYKGFWLAPGATCDEATVTNASTHGKTWGTANEWQQFTVARNGHTGATVTFPNNDCSATKNDGSVLQTQIGNDSINMFRSLRGYVDYQGTERFVAQGFRSGDGIPMNFNFTQEGGLPLATANPNWMSFKVYAYDVNNVRIANIPVAGCTMNVQNRVAYEVRTMENIGSGICSSNASLPTTVSTPTFSLPIEVDTGNAAAASAVLTMQPVLTLATNQTAIASMATATRSGIIGSNADIARFDTVNVTMPGGLDPAITYALRFNAIGENYENGVNNPVSTTEFIKQETCYIRITSVGGSSIPSSTPSTLPSSSSVCTPASITTTPQNQTIASGGTATFTVIAAGTAPLSYQWLDGTTPIGGATSAAFTTPALTATKTYTVRVTNGCNTTGAAANVTVTVGTSTTPTTIPPTTIAGLTCGSTTLTGFTATWTRNTTAVDGYVYDVRVKDQTTVDQSGTIAGNATVSKAVTNLLAAKTYTFRIAGKAGALTGPYASVDCTTVTPVGPSLTLTAIPDRMPADGTSIGKLVAKLTNAPGGNGGKTITFMKTGTDQSTLLALTAVTAADGTATADVKASPVNEVGRYAATYALPAPAEPLRQTAQIIFENGCQANFTLYLTVPLEGRDNITSTPRGTHATTTLSVETTAGTQSGTKQNITTDADGNATVVYTGWTIADNAQVTIGMKDDQHVRRVVRTTAECNSAVVHLGNPATYDEVASNVLKGKRFLPAGDISGGGSNALHDNVVDPIDIAAWVSNFTKSATIADLDRNGKVGAEDLSLIIRNMTGKQGDPVVTGVQLESSVPSSAPSSTPASSSP